MTIWLDKTDDFCYTEFVDYVNRVKKYAGKPTIESILGGFGGGCSVYTGKRYILNDLPKNAIPEKDGICDDCKFLSREQLEEDFADIKKGIQEAKKEGFVNVVGIPYTSCQYRGEWWYERKDTKIIPSTLSVISSRLPNFKIAVHGEVQKKKVLNLDLELGIDFIYSDDTFTSNFTFSSKESGKVDIKAWDIGKYPEAIIFSELFDSGIEKINKIMSDETQMKERKREIIERVKNKNAEFENVLKKNKWISNTVIKGFYDLAKCDNL